MDAETLPMIQWGRATAPKRIPFADALALARNLKYGPLPTPTDPTPTPEEAASIIAEEARTCGFTWLTGACALQALGDHLHV